MSCKGCNYYPPKEDWPCTSCRDYAQNIIAAELEEMEAEETGDDN